MIKRVDENGNEKLYKNLEEASRDIPSKFDYWKIQLFIATAIMYKTKAFKCSWYQED